MNKIKMNSGTPWKMQDTRLLKWSPSPGRRSWRLATTLWSSSASDSPRTQSTASTMRKGRSTSWGSSMKQLTSKCFRIFSELKSSKCSSTVWWGSSRWSTWCATVRFGSSRTTPPSTRNWSKTLPLKRSRNTPLTGSQKGLVLHSYQNDEIILTILKNSYYLESLLI